jgi:hypothetical protein
MVESHVLVEAFTPDVIMANYQPKHSYHHGLAWIGHVFLLSDNSTLATTSKCT